MIRLLTAWVLSAAALATAAWLLGERMTIGEPGAELSDQLITLAIVAAVFTLINQFIAPIIKLLSLPFIILTLGLALLLINAGLLLLTERIAEAFGTAFFIESFGWAILASIVISIVNAVLGAFTDR